MTSESGPTNHEYINLSVYSSHEHLTDILVVGVGR